MAVSLEEKRTVQVVNYGGTSQMRNEGDKTTVLRAENADISRWQPRLLV